MLSNKTVQSGGPSPAPGISKAVGLTRPFFRHQRAAKTGYLPAWSPFVTQESHLSARRQAAEASRQETHQSPFAAHPPHREEVDPLYLFACHIEWERRLEPSAAWEIVSAAQSSHDDTRAYARELLACSHQVDAPSEGPLGTVRRRRYTSVEANVKTRLAMIDSCAECKCTGPGFFCSFSGPALQGLEQASHHTTLPAGAILFVEGQMPRGIFVLCSGRVKLSTASREGKVLILKFAEAGEALGLSAAISGMNYEMTAETATPCQLNYIDRKNLLGLIESHTEVGMRTAQSLSRDFQFAYRDMHDLVLARSSTGKLARLLLSSCAAEPSSRLAEGRVRSGMTHEEMAQRIGASRETVTRLLSDLKKRQLIRLDGAILVIRDRLALEALAV